jgi:co-chaperonin GroES (HSP10)
MPVNEWKVVGPRLLLRPIDINAGSGLLKAESSGDDNLTRECEIVAMGTFDAPWELGQRVMIGLYKGAKVEIDGEELIVVDAETDVLLVKKEPV